MDGAEVMIQVNTFKDCFCGRGISSLDLDLEIVTDGENVTIEYKSGRLRVTLTWSESKLGLFVVNVGSRTAKFGRYKIAPEGYLSLVRERGKVTYVPIESAGVKA
jgi:hypothetical protein